MGITIIGPYERFRKYIGQSFAGVVIGTTVNEPEGAINRRSLCDHGFSEEQLREIKTALIKNADYGYFTFGDSGFPLDWRNEDSEILERLSDETFTSAKIQIASVNSELLFGLQENPEMFYELSPRKFEEVIAEMLSRMGYEISLTSTSKDGGVDVYAAKKESLGSFLYLVQCKKYAPKHKVGVEIVRELYGTVNAENATAGIVATTSYFTKGAVEFQQHRPYQISLKDINSLREWLANIKR